VAWKAARSVSRRPAAGAAAGRDLSVRQFAPGRKAGGTRLHLGPAELEAAARALADRHGASLRTIVGEALLAENFPLIHAVGRASSQAPRLIDLTWGDVAAPKVTIVGKGVTFDTGGLGIKPESAMLIMKKDMGGAASALALANMVMDRGLELR